jgi:hypothetical protein
MKEVPYELALRTVYEGLQADVLPALEDPHAAATMKAALGILRNVAAGLGGGEEAARALLAAGIEPARGWAHALEPTEPDVAARVALLARQAADLSERDPLGAREALLSATRLTVHAIWANPTLRGDQALLASVRRISRQDVEARLALSR